MKRHGLLSAAEEYAKTLWPDEYVTQGTWVKSNQDLVGDGSLVLIDGKYQVSPDGLNTLAAVNQYF